ncbi:MAG: tRNA (cytidine(34)-2'-O)-methyltransferase [Wenzhouxiangella sp.]|nr:MAG: tRNA (cytidine(34)-2'-O)-methyltransferase [Wenzhouxiangella sp.]
MFEIVLYRPEIPPNTGNIMRLCVNAPARLHLIEPLGFSLDDKRLRRAGMDYREMSATHAHRSLAECREMLGSRPWLAFSSHARRLHADWQFQGNEVLLFGRETSGLPPEIVAELPPGQRLRIPQLPGARSLNLANSVAVVVYEAWRQLGFAGQVSRSRA